MKTSGLLLIGGLIVVGVLAYKVFDQWSMNWMNSPEGQQKIGQSNYAKINIA